MVGGRTKRSANCLSMYRSRARPLRPWSAETKRESGSRCCTEADVTEPTAASINHVYAQHTHSVDL